jgi:hypothetical protein
MGQSMETDQVALLRLLATRLERLSADSIWARRASGLRGNLLKVLEEIDNGSVPDPARLQQLSNLGFKMLAAAAREIPIPKTR